MLQHNTTITIGGIQCHTEKYEITMLHAETQWPYNNN